MKWIEAKGVQPRVRAEKVFVRYRNGLASKQAYPLRAQRWSLVGSDWDIVAYSVPPREVQEEAA